ncbi:DUF924 family protein [Nitrosomonas sp.]|uniref:DUF924 family protein n=1 Tax=Nitrosomonas sp. TaxID=42353 RepID=UPI002082320D|nr:DUF924 family protein [Nitrosomonas sp.]GJL76002.1 MAG: membrane protein [Nitrosomonas sp.]
MYNEIHAFWFEETEPKMWWASDPDFDGIIKQCFLPVLHQAVQGELFSWRVEPKGRLAEIIVLDQFSRNIYRDTPAAFAQDPIALVLAQEAVDAGVQNTLSPQERGFLLSPYMHSESKLIHVQAEALYRKFASQRSYEFELKHKAIIDRFGRYPHRNRILGRVSSAQEIAFLKQPGSGF